jgi:hypothetical protein
MDVNTASSSSSTGHSTASISFATPLLRSSSLSSSNSLQANVDYHQGSSQQHTRTSTATSRNSSRSSSNSGEGVLLHQSAADKPNGLVAAAYQQPSSLTSALTTAPSARSTTGSFVPLQTSAASTSSIQSGDTGLFPRSQVASQFKSTNGDSSTAYRSNHTQLELGLGWSSQNPTSSLHQEPALQRAGSASSLAVARLDVEFHKKNNKRKEKGGTGEERGGHFDDTQQNPSSIAQQQQQSSSSNGGRPGQRDKNGLTYGKDQREQKDDEDDDDDELGGDSSSMQGDYTRKDGVRSASSLPSGTVWESADTKDTGSTRKQNSACDACRNRKVRCKRVAGEDKCSHCKTKNIECTTIFVQMASAGVKRPSKRSRNSADETTEG